MTIKQVAISFIKKTTFLPLDKKVVIVINLP